MKISAVEDTSLRCLRHLAREGERTTIGRIAAAEGLTVENTAKILAGLRQGGLILSYRGKDGGYALARPAEEITVAEVLRAIGGPLFQVERCKGPQTDECCVHDSDCGIRPLWTRLDELVQAFFSAITLADLAHPETRVTEVMAAVGARSLDGLRPLPHVSTETSSPNIPLKRRNA